MLKQELAAPCGLYCGVCGIYHATESNDEKLKDKLARAYGMKAEDINCLGCLSDTVFTYCRVCTVKSCTAEKNIEGCHRCDGFPCDKIENFPIEEGKKHILRAVPRRRELGTEAWAAEEEKLHSCPSCRAIFFRGARKCRQCGTLLV